MNYKSWFSILFFLFFSKLLCGEDKTFEVSSTVVIRNGYHAEGWENLIFKSHSVVENQLLSDSDITTEENPDADIYAEKKTVQEPYEKTIPEVKNVLVTHKKTTKKSVRQFKSEEKKQPDLSPEDHEENPDTERETIDALSDNENREINDDDLLKTGKNKIDDTDKKTEEDPALLKKEFASGKKEETTKKEKVEKNKKNSNNRMQKQLEKIEKLKNNRKRGRFKDR